MSREVGQMTGQLNHIVFPNSDPTLQGWLQELVRLREQAAAERKESSQAQQRLDRIKRLANDGIIKYSEGEHSHALVQVLRDIVTDANR